jgi:low temperature requirement protein LtrA
VADDRELRLHLRTRDGAEERTTAVELFFDLVCAFALIQLARLVLAADLSAGSTRRRGKLVRPRLGPGSLVVAFAAMASLLMSTAIPGAFGPDAWLFAASYVVLQVGRNCAALPSPPGHRLPPVFGRVVAWSLFSAGPWLAGAGVHGTARLLLWGTALAVDLAAPALGYRTPGPGRSRTDDCDVDGGHFAERSQSFVLIALGESNVETGTSGGDGTLTSPSALGVAISFVTIATLWWLYFGQVAEGSRRNLAESDDPGRLARDTYTYLHLPIVVGAIMLGIGDDLLVADPGGHLSLTGAVITVSGPAVYLLGETSVRRRMTDSVSVKRLIVVVTLALLAVLAGFASALGGRWRWTASWWHFASPSTSLRESKKRNAAVEYSSGR